MGLQSIDIQKTITGANLATLEELKTLLGFPNHPSAKDVELAIHLDAAHEEVEKYTGTAMRAAEVTVRFVGVKKSAYLPLLPIATVTDDGGAEIDEVGGRIVGDYDTLTVEYTVPQAGEIAKLVVLKCAAYNYETPVLGNNLAEWKRLAKSISKRSFIR